MGVFIGSSQKHVDTEPKQALRYAISRLAQESTRRAVQRAFTEECRGQQRAFYRHERVDVLDAWLLGLCHRVCHNELGYAATGFTQRRGHRRRRPESSTLLQDRQHADASIRLYKLANATSEQNAPILPSEDAATRGETALDELREMFARRYTAENVKQPMTNCTRLEPPLSWSVEDVAGEIRRQSSNKSAGGDGIHMLFMKALLSTCFIDLLCALFNECLKQRRTPSRWNETEIHLLVKDKTRRRDALNVRPITLICMFRKVFEKLLLARIEGSPWAVLHPAQAGFRKHYSTSVNAAIVHYALASKSARFALFLDLKSAFDVLDHNILTSRLRRKHCPDTIFDLIAGLGFHGLRSRVIVNGEASSWFPRTRGVLQGSPISPFLFNIYIDPLIEGLNLLSGRIPKSLFYADDGVILVETYEELQALLDQTNKWMVENGIEINVAKCGLVATDRNGGDTIQINGQVVPVADSYPYLGFPVSAKGIDFPRFLTMRMTKARNAARWLDRFSETWGPTHRLRVYRQYFAPIWEYGAPLAAAWSLERSTFGPCLPNADAFEDATRLHGDVITWVAGCGQNLSGVAGNLLGIPKLQLRFNHLRCAFWRRLLNSPVTNPLRALMLHPLMVGYGTRFLKALDASAEWIRILSLDDGSRSIESTFRCWQDYELRAAIALVGKAYKLTRHIPMASRGRGGLPYSDISLSAPTRHQQDLLRYRLGIFQIRRQCRCENLFIRGHESCSLLDIPVLLSKMERHVKRMARNDQDLQKLTDIDWLLNTGNLKRAMMALQLVKDKLLIVWKETLKEDDGSPAREIVF